MPATFRKIVQPGTGFALGKTVTVSGIASSHLNFSQVGSGFTFDVKRARELYDAIGDVMGFNVPVPAPAPAPTPVKRKRPNGPQAYKGNGKHKWEEVSVDAKGAGHTYRLRVPGGFIYRTVTTDQYGDVMAQSTTFVPMPDDVGYVI